MNETEAREFIDREVSLSMQKRFLQILSVIGIANIIGIVGIYWSVHNTARDIAADISKATAEKEALSKVEMVNATLQKAEDTLHEALVKTGNLQTRIDQQEDQKGDLQKQLSSLKGDVDSMVQKLNTVRDTSPQLAIDLLNAVAANKDAASYISRVPVLQNQIDETKAIISAQSEDLSGKIKTLQKEQESVKKDLSKLQECQSGKWHPVTLEKPWTISRDERFSEPAYFKGSANMVFLCGRIEVAAEGKTNRIFQLPEGFRPPKTLTHVTLMEGLEEAAICRVDIESDGRVLCRSASKLPKGHWISLDGINFRASLP